MEVVSSLLPATTVAWQPRAGQWALTVVCKATFLLEPGEARLAQEQDPLAESDQYWDDDATRSLFYASDLVPVKRRADVLLVGHAFAPGGARVRQLVARMVVDKLDKSVGIFADRTRGTDGSIYEGRGFTRMPLVYERAAGGPTTWNPVGVRADMRDSYGNTSLPNLVAPGTAPTEFGEPVGFGPISPSWTPRSELWVFEGWSGNWAQESLPDSFDLGFFNVAPKDQQLETLRDDCMIHLENLHPEHPSLTTSLPGLRPQVSLEGADRRQRQVSMRADALFIDADRGVATMVWRGHTSIERPQEAGRVVIEVEQDRLDDPRTATANAWSPVKDGTLPHLRNEAHIPKEAPVQNEGNRMATRELSRTPARTAATPGSSVESKTSPAMPAMPFGPPKTERPGVAPSTLPPAEGAALPFAAKNQPAPRRGTLIAAEMPPGLLAAATPFAAAAPAPIAAPTFGPKTGPTTPPSPPLSPPPPIVTPAPVQAPPVQPPPVQPMPVQPLPVQPLPVQAAPIAPPMQPMPAMTSALGSPMPSMMRSPDWHAPPSNPGVPLQHASFATMGGAALASDAAAGGSARPGEAAQARRAPTDGYELLWFEDELPPRLLRKAEWKKLLERLERKRPDFEADEAPGEGDAEDRRDVFELLVHGSPGGESGVGEALDRGHREDGRFAPQLVLVSGELQFDFDELESLKASVSTVTPLAGKSDDLKASVDIASQFLATPGLLSPPQVASGLADKIREAFAKWSDRPVPANYLDEMTSRVLLEKKAYQKREVFGAPHLRALLFAPSSTTGIPTYLPEVLAKKLPLYRRMRARSIVEVHHQADQYEEHATALRGCAVARLLSPAARNGAS